MHHLNHLTPGDITRRLGNQPTRSTFDVPAGILSAPCKEAAVLVPFLRMDDEWHLLYIRRSRSELDRHSGQVAFAGGKRDPEDTDLHATALREAEEEIGLQRNDVTILGQLTHHHSISQFRITPVVAQMPWPYSLTLQTSEVDRAFTMPLRWLADPANHEFRQHELKGKPVPVIYFREYDGELLWGATARMTLSLISALTQE